MRNRLSFTFALAALALCGTTPLAAQRPALRLHVAVKPQVQAIAPGQLRVTYTVVNLRSSTDSLFWFIVDRPVAATKPAAQRQPGGRELLTLDRFGHHRIGHWAALDPLVAPGDSLIGLSIEGPGVAGPVPYWISREEILDSVITDDPGDTVVVDGPIPTPDRDSGWTVGIVPAPRPLTAPKMRALLAQHLSVMCRVGLIADRGSCTSLRATIEGGDTRALLQELDARRATQLPEAAYAILATNARLLLRLGGR
jgi:hypothetical protein